MKRCEIGSEFWDVPLTNTVNGVFPKATQWYMSGRHALRAIINDLGNCASVAIPSWCCESIVKPFIDAGIDVKFYPVYWNNGLVQEVSTDCDVLVIMDFFGYSCAQTDLKDYRGVVIRDITHSIFTNEYQDADYYFGSLRKWCGIRTGGYVWTKNGRQLKYDSTDSNRYYSIRENAMNQKAEYISGIRDDKDYLNLFEVAEEMLDDSRIVAATDIDKYNAERLDIDYIKKRRKINAEVLRSAFPDMLIIKDYSSDDCPLFVPIRVPNGKRDSLRRFLIDKEIYCPVHWPVSEYHRIDSRSEDIYRNELSLICDQRYDEKDMNRIIDTINTFFQES